jgi:hypothetical protein
MQLMPGKSDYRTNANKGEGWFLLMQDSTEEGGVYLKSDIVALNEAEFPEFIQEIFCP